MFEQWKVVSGRYRRVYDTKKAAKIDYGQWCQAIEKEEFGLCELYYRGNLKEDWELVEEFGYEDEEEDYEDELYSDYALRGLRFFNNNINGDENDEEDLEEETEDEDAEEENAEEEEEAPKPTPSYIAQKLVEQGISMEDMVKLLLVNLNEYEREFDDFDRVENEMFGRVKSIMNNYNPPVQNV